MDEVGKAARMGRCRRHSCTSADRRWGQDGEGASCCCRVVQVTVDPGNTTNDPKCLGECARDAKTCTYMSQLPMSLHLGLSLWTRLLKKLKHNTMYITASSVHITIGVWRYSVWLVKLKLLHRCDAVASAPTPWLVGDVVRSQSLQVAAIVYMSAERENVGSGWSSVFEYTWETQKSARTWHRRNRSTVVACLPWHNRSSKWCHMTCAHHHLGWERF